MLNPTPEWTHLQRLPASDNNLDLRLLREDPRQLVARYQPLLNIKVKTLVKRGILRPREIEDVIQEVNEILLSRLPAFQAQFSGAATVQTYFSVIIQNACISIGRRRRLTESSLEDLNELAVDPAPEPDTFEILERETQRFKRMLSMHIRNRARLAVCLLIYYRLPLTLEILQKHWPSSSVSPETANCIATYGSHRKEMDEGRRFQLLSKILTGLERRSSTDEAVRKWTVYHLDGLVEMMNAGLPNARYDRGSLEALVEKYFYPNSDRTASNPDECRQDMRQVGLQ